MAAPAVTVEALLTHPLAFGLTGASPVQRAACRVADGLPLGELAEDENVVASLGGEDAVATLPGCRPKEFYLVAAIRGGKSLLCAVLALQIALTIDLSHLGPLEVARVSVVSLDIDKAEVVMGHLMGALLREGGILGEYLVASPKPTSERVRVRRDDGRIVEIVVAAGKRGGGSLVSRWTVCAIFDEACRMLGASDGVVNFDDMRRSVVARLGLLKGGMLVVVSSPWAAQGPVYEAVQTHFGRPSKQLVLMRATGPQLNPAVWTHEAVEELRASGNEASYLNDCLGEFVDPDTSFFTDAELRRCARDVPLVRAPEPGVEYTAAMDGATRGNAWTLVIVGKEEVGEENVESRYFVALNRQWKGTRLHPLRAKDVFAEIAAELERYGLTEVHSDAWGADLMIQWGEVCGVTVTQDDANATTREKRWLNLKTRVTMGRTAPGGIELSPDPILRQDLVSTRKRLKPGGGVKFEHPVTHDGRHADYAPALVLAVEKSSSSPGWISAMRKARANGVFG